MTKQRNDAHIMNKGSHSKTFNEKIGILVGEIELAFQWNRPSILLAIHNSKIGHVDAQQSLEQEVVKRNKKVVHVNIDSSRPDVIRALADSVNLDETVFFVSGIKDADQASDGRVYRALNLSREILVESCICVVFWLNVSEAVNLPEKAPDFWAFRHRVVEFSPKRGTKNQFVPAGLFLWQEQSPWITATAQNDKLLYYETSLSQLPKEDSSASAQIEVILKLIYYSWLLDDQKKFASYLEKVFVLLEKYPFPLYQAWALNAKAIDLYEVGKKKEAYVYFIQALDYDPNNSLILINLCITTYGLGRNRDAIQTGRRAVKKAPNNLYLWRVLGYLLLYMGRVENAIESMEKARALDVDDFETKLALAVCYYKNDQFTKHELLNIKKISNLENILQQICVDILNNKSDEAHVVINHILEKGRSTKYQILRDPNLPCLVNLREFISD